METTPPRFNPLSLIAPGLVSISLLASALIIAHRPPTPAFSASTVRPSAVSGVVSAPVLPPPPITQASAAAQFRAQVLAAPTLHTLLYKGQTYTLADLKVTQVIYTVKDDSFQIKFDWVWQPNLPAGATIHDFSILTNDGYNHYFGSAVFNPGYNGYSNAAPLPSADVTLK